jgi:hypothetical protein
MFSNLEGLNTNFRKVMQTFLCMFFFHHLTVFLDFENPGCKKTFSAPRVFFFKFSNKKVIFDGEPGMFFLAFAKILFPRLNAV